MNKPALRVFTTTLWEYPSQDYGRERHGDKDYVGATPAWVVWQLLTRYTRAGDVVLDPMCGSGTTLDVARELGRKGVGFDLVPTRGEIGQADARHVPLGDGAVDFVFVDPPYSTHVEYSEDPRCIGKLEAGEVVSGKGSVVSGQWSVASEKGRRESGEEKEGNAYFGAMGEVIGEVHRVLKNRRYMGLYVSDSFKKGKGFVPLGFELFGILRRYFKAIDIVAVVRHNRTLKRGHWHTAAVEGNYFLRGFNYLFIMKKEDT